jgi:hypothetical protein
MSEKSSPAARLLFLVLWLWHLSIAVCGEAALVSHTPKVTAGKFRTYTCQKE